MFFLTLQKFIFMNNKDLKTMLLNNNKGVYDLLFSTFSKEFKELHLVKFMWFISAELDIPKHELKYNSFYVAKSRYLEQNKEVEADETPQISPENTRNKAEILNFDVDYSLIQEIVEKSIKKALDYNLIQEIVEKSVRKIIQEFEDDKKRKIILRNRKFIPQEFWGKEPLLGEF